MAETFYPFVEGQGSPEDAVRFAARIAVYDDPSAAPRVVMVQPTDVRSYLEEITATTNRLAAEQGGRIPFMVIREIVENLIHAYFAEPIVSILDGGNTIRFADQGPGIADKTRALEYGTSSATDEMKRYIRGVGSGLPYVQQYLLDKGGSLDIDDNMGRGTVVTISLAEETKPQEKAADNVTAAPVAPANSWQQTPYQPVQQALVQPPQQPYQQPYVMPGAPMVVGAWPAAAPGWPAAAPAMAAAPAAQPAPTYPTAPAISERGRLALSYLAAHESVGPTELASLYGSSQSTWTRELKALEQLGLVAKRGGQKRYLTPKGRAALG